MFRQKTDTNTGIEKRRTGLTERIVRVNDGWTGCLDGVGDIDLNQTSVGTSF